MNSLCFIFLLLTSVSAFVIAGFFALVLLCMPNPPKMLTPPPAVSARREGEGDEG